MRWLNKILANIAPEHALKAEIARLRIDRLRGQNDNYIDRFLEGRTNRATFGAIDGGRLRKDFLTSRLSPDSAAMDGAEALRNQVRSLEYNNGRVAGPIRRITENVIGQGITFQANVVADDNDFQFPRITEPDAKEFNFTVEKAWAEWVRISDSELNHNFYEQQALVESALDRDGELLAVFRNSGRRSRKVFGRQIPLCIELLEIDRLQTPIELSGDDKIRNGVRYDDEGVKKSFFVLKLHPGDAYPYGEKMAHSLPTLDNMEEIEAFDKDGTPKVSHLYYATRPEQTRGYSQLAPGLKDLQDLDRYMEAEKLAALEDACMTGIVTTSRPSTFAQNYTEPSGSSEYNQINEFAPGKWHYLRPGEEAKINSPTRPNSAFDSYTKELLSGPANGLNIPPEVANQDWQGMNYSNARTVLLQFYLAARVRQRYIINHFCYWSYIKLLRVLISKGVVKAPGYDRRKSDYEAHYWVPPGWEWVDPKKEAEGKSIELNMATDTLTNIAAGKGRDIDTIIDTRGRELQKIQKAEEKYNLKPGSILNSMQEPEAEEEPDIEDEVDDEETGARSVLSVV